jgi:hypothetical protein
VTEIKSELTEDEVRWHLSGDIQPAPPFGSEDMRYSDKSSKLHVSQRGEALTLTGNMSRLKISRTYASILQNLLSLSV